MSIEQTFEIPLTYRNVLPRLRFLAIVKDNYFNRHRQEYYRYGGHLLKQLDIVSSQMDKLPDTSAQKLHKNTCVYCGVENPFNGKGDHLINKKHRDNNPELDNLLWRVNCCKICNSSKGPKDMLEWFVGKKNYSITKLSGNLIGVYCRAMWYYCKNERLFDNIVPEYYIVAVKQMHLHLNQPSYYKIWSVTNDA